MFHCRSYERVSFLFDNNVRFYITFLCPYVRRNPFKKYWIRGHHPKFISKTLNLILIFYFIFYLIITTSIVIIFHFLQSFHFNHIYNERNIYPSIKFVTFLSLLSLGGLPPFTGFFPKWILIQEIINHNLYLLLSVLLASALITLYYYLRISTSIFNLSSLKLKPRLIRKKKHVYTPIFIRLNLFGLLTPICFIFF